MNIVNWFSQKIKKIGFEDIKIAIVRPKQYIIINTLPSNEQDCLIKNTIDIHNEEKMINDLLDQYLIKQIHIIIYGKNNTDDSVERKYQQFIGLGFSNVYVYYGGLFEWLLLQDIYGEGEFPTNRKVVDILKYKPPLLL